MRLKILETKNAQKIRKEVSFQYLAYQYSNRFYFQLICVRKFLGLEDQELAIYDETRKKDGNKTQNRHVGKPKSKQLINSSGEKTFDAFPSNDEADDDESPLEIQTQPSLDEDEANLKDD